MNIYEEPNKINKPFITVWINGQPVNLEFDTGASGVLINQGAVPIPQSAYTSQTSMASLVMAQLSQAR
jgi:hypothetical protein